MAVTRTKTHEEVALKNGEEVTVTFKFQATGVHAAMQLIWDTEGDNMKRMDRVLKEIVSGENMENITWSFFDEYDNGFELVQSVVAAAVTFLAGKQRKKQAD